LLSSGPGPEEDSAVRTLQFPALESAAIYNVDAYCSSMPMEVKLTPQNMAAESPGLRDSRAFMASPVLGGEFFEVPVAEISR